MWWMWSAGIALGQDQWLSEPIARQGPVRSIGMAVDGGTGERFFVLDELSTLVVDVPLVGPVPLDGPPEVKWVTWDGTRYSPPVVVADGISGTESYMPSVATAPGSTVAIVGSRFDAGRQRTNFETTLVHRSTGQVLATTRGVADDFASFDQGRLNLRFDGRQAHACFTAHVNGDDLAVNHTRFGRWQDPLTGFGYTLDFPGVQDHCALALRADGTRVVVNHESGWSEHVSLTFESSVGVIAPGFPREILWGSAACEAKLDHPFVAVDPSADVIHVVASAKTPGGFGILHTSCAVSRDHTCARLTDWSEAEEVVPVGTLAEEPWPEVAVDDAGTVYVSFVDERRAENDRVHVVWQCRGDDAFQEDGTVEDRIGDQAYGSYGFGDVHNAMLGGPHLAIDPSEGTVNIAYLLVDQATTLAMNAWHPLATCP